MPSSAAKVLLALVLFGPNLATSESDCAGRESCAADADEASLLAQRHVKRTEASSRRRGGGCSAVTGTKTTVSPSVTDFTGMSVGGDFDVTYDDGHPYEVTVQVDTGLTSYLDVSVNSGVLTIGWQNSVWSLGCNELPEPDVLVKSPTFLTSISASASAEVQYPPRGGPKGYGLGPTVDSITLSATSSGKVQVKSLTVTSADISASSSGEVDVKYMTADTVTITASSDGDVDGGKTNNMEIQGSSGAEVEFTITGTATGSLSSGAVLKHSGGGDVSGVQISSGARIKIQSDD